MMIILVRSVNADQGMGGGGGGGGGGGEEDTCCI